MDSERTRDGDRGQALYLLRSAPFSHLRIPACTSCACSGVATLPVPIAHTGSEGNEEDSDPISAPKSRESHYCSSERRIESHAVGRASDAHRTLRRCLPNQPP